MLPGRGILGALLRSRRDYGSEPPRTAPGTTKCTEKGKVRGQATRRRSAMTMTMTTTD